MILYHILGDLSQSATKCMTGKSLCEMRGCVYISMQILRKDFNFNKGNHWFQLQQILPSISSSWRLRLMSPTSWWRPTLGCPYVWFFAMHQRIVWDAATFGGTLHYQLDEPTSFFISLLPFLFFLSHVPLPRSKPVGLSQCACKGIIYHLCLRRLALNKTHDREIALWNGRTRINLDANVEEVGVIAWMRIQQSIRWTFKLRLQFLDMKRVFRKRLGCRNLRRHSQLHTWWTHIFFFLHPYRSCSSATFSSTFSTWGRRSCHRTRAGDQEGWAGGAQHAE